MATEDDRTSVASKTADVSAEQPAEPSPEQRHPPPDTSAARARVAAVLGWWSAGVIVEAPTEDELWLQKQFTYWARQLPSNVSDPRGELLSELGTRLDSLHRASRGYVTCVLRNAFLDVVRRVRGRGAARREAGPSDDLDEIEGVPAEARYQLLEALEDLVDADQLTPRSAEALELRASGISDEQAGAQSQWPCTAVAFRRRVHDAVKKVRSLRRTPPRT